MSLTSELKNLDSELNMLFSSYLDEDKVLSFLQKTNEKITSDCDLIIPVENTNYSLVGTAMPWLYCKYFLNSWGYENSLSEHGFDTYIRMFDGYLPRQVITEFEKDVIEDSKVTRERLCFWSFILAGMEQLARTNTWTVILDFLGASFTNWRHNEEFKASVMDIYNLSDFFIQNKPDQYDSNISFSRNQTFVNSRRIYGADAQIAVFSEKEEVMLVSNRTTKARYPFTYDFLKQQIGYCILNEKKLNITHLEWVFVRQRKRLVYKLDELIDLIGDRRLKQLVCTREN